MKNRVFAVLLLSSLLFPSILINLTTTSPVSAQSNNWKWISPDVDGDGLPNEVEESGWCNAVGCFQTDPFDPDSDNDGLTDGEEKLFDSNPLDNTSPGIYVIYEDSLNTKKYYPWQQYGHKLIARGDDFDPPNPDVIDMNRRHGVDLDAVVVRRGATFYVGGPVGADLIISKSISTLSSLSKSRVLGSGRWRVQVPSGGTVGKYTLTLGGKSVDLFVVFELPGPSGELTQTGLEKFLYSDDPNKTFDEKSMMLGVNQYNYSYGFVSEGKSYAFNNQQYNRYLLEDYVMKAINGKSSQRSAADALTEKVDALTIFRNPRVLYDSLRVINPPGSNPRNQCSNVAGLLTSFNRASGIPARPVMIDWRHSSFDHATEIWLNGGWRVYRGYKDFEMAVYPNNTREGCSSGWPKCGSYKYVSRSDWGKNRYRPWHSGGGGKGNVLVLASDNWVNEGLAYRWPSWDIDTIKLDERKFKTQNAKYWTTFGWSQEPVNTGIPGWPSSSSATSFTSLATSNDPTVGSDENGLAYHSAQIEIGEVVAEYGVDLNNNGQYDQLVLEVAVEVNQPGTYWLRGQLSAGQPDPALFGTGGVIAETLVNPYLETGSQIIQLNFAGDEISLKHVDGPYVLSGLWITNMENPDPVDFMNNSLAYRGYAYTTGFYQASAFETYGAMLRNDYRHYELDSDGDGRVDGLLVNTGLNINQPGDYAVEGSLYDARDEFVALARWNGPTTEVDLAFPDVAGHAGPYTLRDLELFNAAGQSIDYLNEAYRIELIPALFTADTASFDVYPRANEELIAQGETITPTQVFAEALSGGNLQVEAEVEVSETGSYKLEAWLADGNGNLITWGSGPPTSLGIGVHTLSLTFAGSSISARGMNGPYQVVALKVLKGDAPYEVLDKVDVALTTRAYSAGQFAATHAIFSDSMENGGGQWSAGGNWTITAGRHQYMDISRAWKGNTAASLKLASPLDLSGITGNVALKFQTAYKFGGGETGYLEISKDNNNWESAAVFSGEASWSDRVHIVDLSAYAGEPVVHIRFRLASAGGTSTDGWYIDNVVVAGQEGGALFLPIIFK